MILKDLDLEMKTSRDPHDPLNDYSEMMNHFRHEQFRKELFRNRNNKSSEKFCDQNNRLHLTKQIESKLDSNSKTNSTKVLSYCSESHSSKNLNNIPKILFTLNDKKLM